MDNEKKMTQEQKAKAYDEALKWMRELYPGLHGATKEDAEHYFPELRESEDERIRMWLIDCVKATHDCYFETVTREQVLSYLEKQKEQSTEHKTYDGKALSRSYDLGYRKGVADAEKEMYEESGYTPDESRAYDHGYENGYNDGFDEGVESVKPAEWSEDTKKRIKIIAEFLRYKGYEDDAELIESLRPQPKAEWSEEDEETLEKLHRLLVICRGEKKFIQEADYNKMDNLLKSLRPSWKPSEEQMGALSWMLENARANIDFDPLKDLYEQLKQL